MDFLAYSFKLNSIKINYQNSSNSNLEIYLNEIVQVFINLAKNSSDAMIEKNIQNRLITISTYEKNDSLFIEFEDNAGGIKEEDLNEFLAGINLERRQELFLLAISNNYHQISEYFNNLTTIKST